MLDILFLDTAASVPSKDKSLPGVAVRHGGDIVLFDCGEGTQRQFMFSRMSFMKVRSIFISHMHGDHTLGLPGLLQTMGMSGRTEPLVVLGPKGIREKVDCMIAATEGEIPYQLEYMELKAGNVYDFDSYSVECFSTDHGIESYGFVLREKDRPGKIDRQSALELGIEEGPDFARIKNGEAVRGVRPEQVIGGSRKGLSVAYTGDTRVCDELKRACLGCDALIHESTYMETESKYAAERFHSTAADAAKVAKECGVRYLFLTHVSNRYKNPDDVLGEAKSIFAESYLPADLQMFSVTDRDIRSV